MDLIRAVAIVLVILLHAAIEPNLNVDFMSPQGVQLWLTADAYQSIAIVCVPLFVILSGALLLQPQKTDEPLRVFFKKRWKRIGIPLFFWGVIYFIWQFTVRDQAVSADFIFKGILAGPYYHFWFLYVLIGLYLLTPLLRVLVSYADWKIMRYFLVLWFVGTALVPLIGLYSKLSGPEHWFQLSIFILTGLIGYYILGAYISKFKVQSRNLAALVVGGAFATAAGTYLLLTTLGENYSRTLIDSTSLTAIPTSIGVFLLLASVPTKKIEKHTKTSRILAVISQNTLPIYLFHVIVLETLQTGYLGLQISVSTLNPIAGIPLVTALTLLICLAILVPLKKIPYVRRILG